MFKKMFREMSEKTEYQMYYQGDSLWVSYAPGSGSTAYMPNINKFLTDKAGDKNFDSVIRNIKKFMKDVKPTKSVKNTKMFTIPVYDRSTPTEKFSIWGGDVKPKTHYYMIVTEEKNTIVNIFTSKNEAQAWMRSLA